MLRSKIPIALNRRVLLSGVLFLFTGLFILSVLLSVLSLTALRTGNIERAATLSEFAQPIPIALSTLTWQRVPDLELWVLSLSLPNKLQETQQALTPKQGMAFGVSTQAVFAQAHSSLKVISRADELLQSSFLAKRLFPEKYQVQLAHLSKQAPHLNTLISQLQTGEQRWLVLLQNSDELRAAGGFLGSYASVRLQDGEITELVIEDVYDADGQFKGYVEAPPGVAEYLSSGNGLRLPDANWSPDFPTSAQTVMQFFALGERQGVTGVVAVNHTVVAGLLEITGPIPLLDYSTSLTADNLSEALRESRGEFFPGSLQKKLLLSHAFTQLRLRLAQLSPSQYRAIAGLAQEEIRAKNIQAYSAHPETQQALSMLRTTGEVSAPPLPQKSDCNANCTPIKESQLLQFFPVESNVGINKANRGIHREYSVEITPALSTLSTTFTNSNPPLTELERQQAASSSAALHNGYVNYHRLLVSPGSRLLSLAVNDQPIQSWHQTTVALPDGSQLEQFGFLVTVPEQLTARLQIVIEHPPQVARELQAGTQPQIFLYKQSGLPPTPYTFSYQGNTQHTLLESDSLFTF